MAIIKAILFDFGGTLDHPAGRHWLDRFLGCYREAGVLLSRDELDRAYAQASEKAYRCGERLGEAGLRELVEFLVGLQLEFLSRSAADPLRAQLAGSGADYRRDLCARISGGFVEESRRGLYRSREILGALASRFRLGVISNFYGNLDRVLAESGLLGLLDVTVDSARAGLFKPDPRIFEVALAKLKFPPEEVAMVGDSLGKDCAPARKLGLRTVWLCGEASADSARGCVQYADYTVRTLDELMGLEW